MIDLTLEEARVLYAQGGLSQDIALRAFPAGEILNDYTSITTLPDVNQINDNKITDLYKQLYSVYKQISEGRSVDLTRYTYYLPSIIIAHINYRPKNGSYVGNVIIDGDVYSIYIGAKCSLWEGRLGYERDGVYCGADLMGNRWIFKEKAQALHFVKHFYI